jgi:hypothetical protein
MSVVKPGRDRRRVASEFCEADREMRDAGDGVEDGEPSVAGGDRLALEPCELGVSLATPN